MDLPAIVPARAFDGSPRAAQAPESSDATPLWDPTALAGRLIEISSLRPTGFPVRPSGSLPAIWDLPASTRDAGGAALTAASSLVWKAQQCGEPCAWINARTSSFFPPDLDAGGIDLAALVVVRTPTAAAAARAADKLLRSGTFGLLVLDLGGDCAVPAPLLSRLLGLAQKHHALVVFLTEKSADAASLAPIVSLRVAASRRRSGSARFVCSVQATKDKRHAPGWVAEETFRGPPGLR